MYILLLEFWLVALIIFKVRKMKRANFYVRLSGGPSPAHPFHRRGFELARILPWELGALGPPVILALHFVNFKKITEPIQMGVLYFP